MLCDIAIYSILGFGDAKISLYELWFLINIITSTDSRKIVKPSLVLWTLNFKLLLVLWTLNFKLLLVLWTLNFKLPLVLWAVALLSLTQISLPRHSVPRYFELKNFSWFPIFSSYASWYLLQMMPIIHTFLFVFSESKLFELYQYVSFFIFSFLFIYMFCEVLQLPSLRTVLS